MQSLKDWDGVAGAYILVFDEYRQFYVGKADDIRKRIKHHWGARKYFDRLVFPNKYESVFPVDELRALDTTRIYAARSTNPYAVEERAEKAADKRFCLNRMPGGEAGPFALMLSAIKPRGRSHGVLPVPLSWEGYEQVWDGVVNLIAQASSPGPDLVAELARLDMTVHTVSGKDDSRFMWSRRDGIASAVVRGELCVENFAAFLEAMGETIIWPEDRT
ncbi:hypothetical protein GCM10023063_48650 [Arthrobacter methylotrophus]|uniref:GIY-YIG nuclease family protein n=1 Tax=Arthrobacter methylotrophus TaxID=121291 RepID=UPI0031EB02C4